MACVSRMPDNPGEAELWAVGQELKTCLPTHVSLTPVGYASSMQIQLSPISFLPNEILIEIFHYGLTEIPHSARALTSPIVAAGVCKSWHTVVLGTPELWTKVFVTSATTIDRLRAHLERSKNLDIDASFCHWSAPKSCQEVNSSEAFLESIVVALQPHAHRMQSLTLWGVSDMVVCTVMRGFINIHTPRLASVSIKANITVYTHYYQSRDLYLLPCLGGRAPSLTHLDVDYFPIETFRMRSGWPFNVDNLTSLTLRTQEWPTLGYFLPPYLIEFTALCGLLRSTPRLTTLALYGPVIEPDEDFEMRPARVSLPVLETLIIHRCDPGFRYHCELLGILHAPSLKRLEIPWHDDLSLEAPYGNYAEGYLLSSKGQPRFASVTALYLHDSAVRWKMPTRSLIKAFPNVEEVVLGGTDVVTFAATLRGFVHRVDSDSGSASVLAAGAWQTVKRIVLKEPEMARWKGWMRGFCKWLAAQGHLGQVVVEIRDTELCDDDMKAFRRGIERLRRYARVTVV